MRNANMLKSSSSAAVSSPYPAAMRNLSLVIGASLFMAICARLSVPLPFTPIPLTLGNFAVLLIGLVLGSRRGMAALLLYLAEGAAGAPVFSPAGPGGPAQLLGPTGGYLLAYPLVAFVTGWLAERQRRTFPRLLAASLAGEVLLFACGLSWIAIVTRASLAQAAWLGAYPFFFAEVIKVMAAPAIALRVSSGAVLGPLHPKAPDGGEPS
jgi:biotin transport system substrate-specific component